MYSRRRASTRSPSRSIPRKYLRAYGAQRSIRRMYPPSKFGYMAIPRTDETKSTFGPSYVRASAEQRAARASHRYIGRGSYWKSAWRKVIRPIGKAALRGALGAAKHSALGILGGGMYTGNGMYTGQGEYSGPDNYTTNDLVHGGEPSVADIKTAEDETGSITISKREYISDIFANPSGSSFVNQSFPLNPGLEPSFPWLSQLAQNYEEYEFQQLLFSFRSTIQDVNSANGQVGTIISATNYNPSAAPFSDKNAMMTYAHAVSAKSTDDLVHGVECDPTKLSGPEGKYIRSGALSQTEDIKSYDHAVFQLAISNTPSSMANQSIGELWVTYTVVLRKPKFGTARGNNIQQYSVVSPSGSFATATASTNYLFVPSSTALYALKNNLNCSLYSSTTASSVNGIPANTILRFPAAYSGLVRVLIKATYTDVITTDRTVGTQVYLNAGIGVTGNVRTFNDIYAGNSYAPGVQSSVAGADLASAINYMARVAGTQRGQFILIQHFLVSPASSGLDNAIYIASAAQLQVTIGGGVGTFSIAQMSLDVTEMNPTFATSPTVDVPQYINTSGVITAVT